MKSGEGKTVFLTTIVLLLLFAIPAMAEQKKANPLDTPQMFNIEAGSLEETLEAYSKTTGIRTVYLNELVTEKKSQGVQGTHSPEAALRQILQKTGLTYQLAANDTVVLKKNHKAVVEQEKNHKTSPQEN